MNGSHFPCGKFVGSLRKQLFKEHLGLIGRKNEAIEVDVTDPISDHFYNEIWHQTASYNTDFYEKVFHCIPSDKIQTFSDLKGYQDEKPLYISETSRAQKMLESIEVNLSSIINFWQRVSSENFFQGHLVLLPLNFLSRETLTPNTASVEGMMPTSLWT